MIMSDNKLGMYSADCKSYEQNNILIILQSKRLIYAIQ